MKTKTIIALLVVCITLSGCVAVNNAKINSGTTKEPIVTPSKSEVPDYLNFSNHIDPDESEYKTILADPSKISAGERVFSLQEKSSNWTQKFEGFIKDANVDYDVRSCNVSDVDFSAIKNYNELTFDTNTVWPKSLPQGFDPEQILEYNKNPGLGIRDLHKKGITGKGVSIAIIDQPLLLDHEQYKDNLMYYERVHASGDGAQMHGPAVASIAVGNTIGVAPDAKLYYIATSHGHYTDGEFEFDASIIADCVLRVLELNKYLPDSEKIRVIAISKGYGEGDIGYKALNDAIAKAEKQNVFVLTTNTEEYYNFALRGMEREYLKDPDEFTSYTPSWWKAEEFYANPEAFKDDILVPMGSRTIASNTGNLDYAIANKGGSSWAVPWFAGLYALSCQVNPEITPKEFIEVVRTTSVTTDLEYGGKSYKFGNIVNPAEIIKQLLK